MEPSDRIAGGVRPHSGESTRVVDPPGPGCSFALPVVAGVERQGCDQPWPDDQGGRHRAVLFRDRSPEQVTSGQVNLVEAVGTAVPDDQVNLPGHPPIGGQRPAVAELGPSTDLGLGQRLAGGVGQADLQLGWQGFREEQPGDRQGIAIAHGHDQVDWVPADHPVPLELADDHEAAQAPVDGNPAQQADDRDHDADRRDRVAGCRAADQGEEDPADQPGVAAVARIASDRRDLRVAAIGCLLGRLGGPGARRPRPRRSRFDHPS